MPSTNPPSPRPSSSPEALDRAGPGAGSRDATGMRAAYPPHPHRCAPRAGGRALHRPAGFEPSRGGHHHCTHHRTRSPVPPSRRQGFRVTPVPHYSTTTRGGTHVSCGGCCLPLPLGCLVTVLTVVVPPAVSA